MSQLAPALRCRAGGRDSQPGPASRPHPNDPQLGDGAGADSCSAGADSCSADAARPATPGCTRGFPRCWEGGRGHREASFLLKAETRALQGESASVVAT